METTTKLIDVMLCCNDHYGNTSTRIEMLNIPDLIDLDGPMGGGKFGMGEKAITLEGKQFCFDHASFLVGNIFWNCIYVTPQVAADILNHLRACRGWDCEEAEKNLFEIWKQHEKFTVRDILYDISVEQEALFDVSGAKYYDR